MRRGRAEIRTRTLGPWMSMPATAVLSCLANVELFSLSLKIEPNYVYVLITILFKIHSYILL